MALPYLLLGLAFPYAVLRLRDAQSRQVDPQLGLKVALHFFLSLGILIALTGLTIMAIDFIVLLGLFRSGVSSWGSTSEPFPSAAQRTGLGLVVSGVVFTGLHAIFLLALTRGRGPARRLFLGWRFAIHGVVVMLTASVLAAVLMQKPETQSDALRQMLFGTLVVWTPSWLLHFVLLSLSSPRARAQPPGPEPEWQERPYRWDETREE